MAEGKCAKCSKFFLVIFNLLLWITGGTMLGLGIYVLVSNEVENFLRKLLDINIPLEFIYTAAYIFVAVGAFVFLAGFCGCCGAIRESACMLGIYIACIVIVILGEIAAGIYIGVQRGHLEQTLRGTMLTSIQNYTDNRNSTMDFLQTEMQCCGADNFTDYWTISFPERGKNVPVSCCVLNPDRQPLNYTVCQAEASNTTGIATRKFTKLHTDGCFTRILDWLNEQSVALIGAAVGIACFQFLGIIFAVCLCRNRSEFYDDD